jgi:hypothetical protein
MGKETKSVCADCFMKWNAKDVVSQGGVIGKCDYCGRQNVKVMSVCDVAIDLVINFCRQEDNNKENARQKGYIDGIQGGIFDSGLLWNEAFDLDRENGREDFIDSLTENKILQNDIKNCLFEEKESV